MLATAVVTTSLIWGCTGLLIALDSILILVSRRLVGREQFKQMRKLLTVAGGVFFLGVWISVLWWGWDWFYSYIFPDWGRYLLPLIFGIGYTMVASAMVWLSLKLPGNPAMIWCLLGGVEGLISHLYAIYYLGAATKPPLMQGSDPFVVLIFAIFEKAFYWSLILLACTLIWRFVKSRSRLGLPLQNVY